MPALSPDLDSSPLLEAAHRTLSAQRQVLDGLLEGLGERFLAAVDALAAASGRVIVTGMGKSGIIAHKIAATLASTGTPALFLHPAEAIHGDLGMITPQDVVLAISNSGETEEVLKLLPVLALMKVPFVSMSSRPESTLAREAAVALNIPLEDEGCPIGLAPMASTTGCLALGDALASALMAKKGFQPKDYALFHPGGSLGRKLLTRVQDLMLPLAEIETADPTTPTKDVIRAMISSNLGAILVLEEDGKLAGLVTDGDLKRIFDREPEAHAHPIREFMTAKPTVGEPSWMAEKALQIMEDRPHGQISVLPVVDSEGLALGLIRLHDIIRAKIR